VLTPAKLRARGEDTRSAKEEMEWNILTSGDTERLRSNSELCTEFAEQAEPVLAAGVPVKLVEAAGRTPAGCRG